MEVKNTIFVNYGKDRCQSKKGTFIFSTNPGDEDLNHPIHVEGAKLIKVSKEYLTFLHRPSLGKINPSDCVGEF